MRLPISLNKNGYYSLRFRVHKTLIPYFHKSVIKKSLQTKSKKFAILKASKLYYEYQKILNTLSIITSEQTQELIDKFIQEHLKQNVKPVVVVDENKYKLVSSLTLKEAYIKYCLWYKQQNITQKQYNATTNKLSYLILPFFGETTLIEDVTIEMINDFKIFLTGFPNINKKEYKHLSFNEIKQLKHIPEKHMIGINTQQKYLTILKQFFSYMTKSNLLTYNPCSLLNMPDTTALHREAFSDEEMKRIFQKISTLDDRQYIYFTLAYTGMRPSEFWKAKINVSEEGVLYFDLTDSSLKLKTSSSYRFIPLHKNLINMGIHHKLKSLQENFTQAGISSYFNKTIKPLITNNSNKIMYSFRHTVATKLKRAEIDMDMVAELLGHSYQNITMTKEVYAGNFTIVQLQKAINNLNFL